MRQNLSEFSPAAVLAGQDLNLLFSSPAVYRIRVQGRLPADRRDGLESLAITVRKSGAVTVTALVGEFADQASLIRLLKTLCGLRSVVLAVERLEASPNLAGRTTD